jgi:hypothetical protein
MTDLLDDLRSANPVDASTLELPPGLCERALRAAPARRGRGTRRRLGLAFAVFAAATAVWIVVLLAPGGHGGARSLAARAYAATTGAGIIHWRTEQHSYSDGHEIDHQRDEGWARNGVTHVVRYEVRRGEARLTFDSRIAGGRAKTYIASADDYLSVPAAKRTSANPLATGDPFAIFRRAYRTGRLHSLGPRRYAVDLPGNDHTGISAIYELDPRTALPTSLTVTGGVVNAGRRYDNRTVMRFTTYQKLPFTPVNRAKLRLLAHPGAGPKDDPAAPHFAVLRGDRRPGPGAMGTIGRLAGSDRRFGLVAGGARAISRGRYLVPGHGYICLGASARKGFGFACVAIAQAVEHGIAMGTPAVGITVGVPDGVRALRARERGGRSETVPVHDNGAKLPFGAYRWEFVR